MNWETGAAEPKGCLGANSPLVILITVLAGAAGIFLFVFYFYSSVNIGNGRVIYHREGARSALQYAEDYSRCTRRALREYRFDRSGQNGAFEACDAGAHAAAQRESATPLVAFIYFTNQGPTPMEDVVIDAAFRNASGDIETQRFSRPFVGYEEVFHQKLRVSSEPTETVVCVGYRFGPFARMYVTMRGEPSLNTGVFMAIDGRMRIVKSHWRFSFFDGCRNDIQGAIANMSG
jgi:hypothetical protein